MLAMGTTPFYLFVLYLNLQTTSNKVLALYNYRALEAGELQLVKVRSLHIYSIVLVLICFHACNQMKAIEA